MKLNKEDFFVLCQTAVAAAKEAGDMIAEYYQKDFVVEKKESGTSLASQVVTEIDVKSQEIILKYLKGTCEICDLALLTEESTDDLSRLEKDYFWCIDPLDGTLPFTEDKRGYSVSIALVSKSGQPFIGVVYDPAKKDIYHAIKGQGAFKNDKAIVVDNEDDHSKILTVIVDRSFTQHDILTDIGYEIEFVQVGGAVMNALAVIDKAPACYIKLPKKEQGGGSLWDFAATACIFNELSVVASDIFGSSLDLNRSDSTFMNHRGVIYASDKKISKTIHDIIKIVL